MTQNSYYSKTLGWFAMNAAIHRDKEPTLGMLLQEVGELALALEGKHEHPPAVELVQIGGIILNWLHRELERGRQHEEDSMEAQAL